MPLPRSIALALALTLPTRDSAPPSPEPVPPAHAAVESPAREGPGPASRFDGVLPRGITSFGAVSTGGWVYLLGGYVGTPHAYVREDQSPTFYRLDALDGMRVEEIPGGDRVQSVALVAHRGNVIRVGGMKVLNGRGEPQDLHSVRTCALYRAGEWVPLPEMPDGRSSHDAAVVGDRLYVAGGWKLDGSTASARWFESMWVLDLTADAPRWEALSQPFKRRALGVAAVGDRLCAVGGMGAGGFSKALHVYDPSTGQWTRGPDFPSPPFGVAVIGVGPDLFASGMDGVVWRWRLGTARWERLGSWVLPRFFGRLAPLPGGRLAILGGMGESARVRHIETLPMPGVPSGEGADGQWTRPWPGTSINRQARFDDGDRIFLFGGNRSPGQHDFDPENFCDEGWVVGLGDLSVSPCAPIPVRRQSMVGHLDAKGESGYLLGGFGPGPDGGLARTHADMFRYDLGADRWERLDVTLPQPRSQFGLVEDPGDGSCWILGGLDYDPSREDDAFRHPMDVLRWDPESPEPPRPTGIRIPRPRRGFGCARVGDRIYMVGGLADGFRTVKECDVLDITTGEWSTIPAPSRPRISPVMVAREGKVYLAGGTSPGGPDPTMECFDPETRTWSRIRAELPVTPPHLAMGEGPGGTLALLRVTPPPGMLRGERVRRLGVALVDPRRVDPRPVDPRGVEEGTAGNWGP